MTAPLLEVTELEMTFAHPIRRGRKVRAVDGVRFTVNPGEVVGLVGESGSGKSTIGRCILGLESTTAGTVSFAGEDITHIGRRARARIATDLQVVFQDPFSSLNPFLTVGESIAEPLRAALRVPAAEAREKVARILAEVGLPPEAADRYPREFSGGQRQRIAIARALVLDPKLVICDEAVSALDLSTQAQVLNLLASLARDHGLAYVFIAHDLDVVHYIADRTVVLYRGRIMEQGDAGEIHAEPLHPYTAALLAAAPVADPGEQRERRTTRRELLRTGTATAPSPDVVGCPFANRCAFAADVCRTTRPKDVAIRGREVACHLYDPASGHPAGQDVSQLPAHPVLPSPGSADAA